MKLTFLKGFFTYLFVVFFFQDSFTQTAAEEAQEMLDLVNELRADNGVDPVILNVNLNTAAFNHSDDMARNNYFSHTGLNGSDFSQRIAATGYAGSPRAENIAAGNLSVTATFNQWVNSSGHLSNMLNTNVNEMGIARAFFNSSKYKHYWTQVFGKGSGVLSNDNAVADVKFSVYPNPVKNSVFVIFQNVTQAPVQMKLFSVNGELMYDKSYSLDAKEMKIDVSNFSSGVYFLKFRNVTKKIVKY